MLSWFRTEKGAEKWLGMQSPSHAGETEKMVVNSSTITKLLRPVYDTPLNLIAIFGAARQGKSFMMNLLAGSQDLFKISNLREPCTSGVDLSRHFIDLDEFSALNGGQAKGGDMKIGFVDAEGQGDRDISYDSRLVTPILLASKVIIFNWKDSLQTDRILNLLAVLAHAAQGIEVGQESKMFGHLHIVFRDWNFVNTSPDQVYRDIFAKEKGRSNEVTIRNHSRATILDCFESVTITLFPAPVSDTASLSDKIRFDQLQTSFQVKLTEFRKVLSEQLQNPTLFNNQPITGRSLDTLMPALAEVIGY